MSPPAVSSRSTRPLDLSPLPACEAPPAASGSHEPDYGAVFDANPALPDISKLVRQEPVALLAFADSRTAAAAKLDAVERRFEGPYRVGGQAITAKPMFHSALYEGLQLRAHPEQAAFAQRICSKSPLSGALVACTSGRPTPEQLVMVTQALIDGGALAGVSPVNAQTIRAMQERFHIGIDCIGYVSVCQIELHGRRFLAAKSFQTLSSMLDTNGLYVKRAGLESVASAQPGDVLHLDGDANTDGREHNVVVRQHDAIRPSDPRWATLTSSGGAALTAKGGPVHMLEVVQSGGGTAEERGVKHSTWFYDEGSKRWGVLETDGTIALSENGPQGHAKGALFAAKRPVQ